MASAYVCGRFKRIWVKKSELPIYQPSAIVDLKPKPDGYISKATETNIDALRVHRGQILLTCSGTIGNVAYVSKTLDGKIFSHDLIRINAAKDFDAGYIYAYLKSKAGNEILLTSSYGAVITHIEPEHLAAVPIPDAPPNTKRRIHELIVRSYALRDESNELVDRATALLISELQLPDIEALGDEKTFTVRLSNLFGRLDASFHDPIVRKINQHLSRYAAEVTTIGDGRISKAVILPGRFKRVYVDEGYGVTFFGGRSIGELDPSDKKYLSFAMHDDKIRDELTIREKMILITCSGTIGKVTLVPKHWNGWAMTHDIIRLIPNEKITGYVYIWLQTDFAAKIIDSFAYGAVVRHIEKNHLEAVPIPLLKNSVAQDEINSLALAANDRRYEAYLLEQQALKILDTEIFQFSRKNFYR